MKSCVISVTFPKLQTNTALAWGQLLLFHNDRCHPHVFNDNTNLVNVTGDHAGLDCDYSLILQDPQYVNSVEPAFVWESMVILIVHLP